MLKLTLILVVLTTVSPGIRDQARLSSARAYTLTMFPIGTMCLTIIAWGVSAMFEPLLWLVCFVHRMQA